MYLLSDTTWIIRKISEIFLILLCLYKAISYNIDRSLIFVRERLASYKIGQILQLAIRKNYFFWNAAYYGIFWSAQFSQEQGVGLTPELLVLYDYQFYYQGLILFLGFLGSVLASAKPNYKLAIALLIFIFGTILHVIFVTDSRYQYLFEYPGKDL